MTGHWSIRPTRKPSERPAPSAPVGVRVYRSRAARHVHLSLGIPDRVLELVCQLRRGHDPVDDGDPTSFRCSRCPRTWRRG